MIHTATLTYTEPCTVDSIRYLNRFQKMIDGTRYFRQSGYCCNMRLQDKGIKLYAKVRSKGYKCIVYLIVINFKRLTEQVERIKLYTDLDYDITVDKFNEYIKELNEEGLNLPEWEMWSTNRIDYCINVRTPYVQEYIKLMQKGDIPYFLRLPYDKKSHKEHHKSGSVYLVSKARDGRKSVNKTGSQTYNFYDKYNEKLNESKKKYISEQELEQARDILRLEVQCFRSKLDYKKMKNKFISKSIVYFLNEYLGMNILEKAIIDVCHKGEYVRRAEANKRIDESKYHKATKENLKLILDTVNKPYGSIAKARKVLVEEDQCMKIDQFRGLLKKLDDMNINPVTISDNKHIPGKSLKEGLPNIYDLFCETCQDQLCLEQSLNDDTYIFAADEGYF